VKEDRIELDTPSTITMRVIDEAKLYTFAIPVFPKGEVASIRENLKNSGISCESLDEWLSSARKTIQKAPPMGIHAPIPKLTIICSKFLELDANNQPILGDTISREELLELGFLLSHSAYIIVFDAEGRNGSSMLRFYLELNWKDWFDKWIDVRRAHDRVKFENAESVDQLKGRLAIPLSFSTLKRMWECEREDIQLVE